jgi:hypothetical protein
MFPQKTAVNEIQTFAHAVNAVNLSLTMLCNHGTTGCFGMRQPKSTISLESSLSGTERYPTFWIKRGPGELSLGT